MKVTFEPDFKSHISLVGGEIFGGEYLKDKSTPKCLYLIGDISYLVFIYPNRWESKGLRGNKLFLNMFWKLTNKPFDQFGVRFVPHFQIKSHTFKMAKKLGKWDKH